VPKHRKIKSGFSPCGMARRGGSRGLQAPERGSPKSWPLGPVPFRSLFILLNLRYSFLSRNDITGSGKTNCLERARLQSCRNTAKSSRALAPAGWLDAEGAGAFRPLEKAVPNPGLQARAFFRCLSILLNLHFSFLSGHDFTGCGKTNCLERARLQSCR
jgi:hypothetical protein